MTKQITKERLLKTLDKVHSFRLETVQADGEIVIAMANLGMKTLVDSTFGNETPAHEFQRTSLELKYREVPKNKAELEAILERWNKNVSRRHHFMDRVFQIQARHNISGLARVTYSLGDREFECWGESDELPLIEADLQALKSDKVTIFDNWLNYAVANGLEFWCSKPKADDWSRCSVNLIRAALQFYDWAVVYESKSYLNEAKMRSQGWCESSDTPTSPDDKLHWEVHLDLGCGVEMDSCNTPRMFFCASNRAPHL